MQKNCGKVSALDRIANNYSICKTEVITKNIYRVSILILSIDLDVLLSKMNQKMNHIHETALRMVYEDYLTSFEDLLIKDKSVSIHHSNIQKVATIMFKVKKQCVSGLLKAYFVKLLLDQDRMQYTTDQTKC